MEGDEFKNFYSNNLVDLVVINYSISELKDGGNYVLSFPLGHRGSGFFIAIPSG